MSSANSDVLLQESISDQQERLKSQMRAVELLEEEFLAFLWREQAASSTQLAERFDRHTEILEGLGGLDAGAVLFLFAKLEQRAFKEINKSLALAQTIDPERIAEQCPDLPRVLLENAKAVHINAYTTRRSRQAADAAKEKSRKSTEAKAAVLVEWDRDGNEYKSRADFARIVSRRDGLKERTVYDWVTDHLRDKV